MSILDLSIFAPKARNYGAAEYLKAKLESEASPYGLKETLDLNPQTVMVVDVRDAESFATEHIRGAANIPAGEIVTRLANLPREKTLVVYCWDMTCDLAPKAALQLTEKGFRAQFLLGGIVEWRHKGFPTVKAGP